MRRRFNIANNYADITSDYLTMEALDYYFHVSFNGSKWEYCIDGDGVWVSSTNGTSITIKKGRRYLLKQV